MKSILVLLFVVIMVVFAGEKAQWCSSPTGQGCLSGENTVLLAEEETTLARYDIEEEEQVLGGKNGASIDTKKYQCQSNCELARAGNQACSKCTRPFVFYNTAQVAKQVPAKYKNKCITPECMLLNIFGNNLVFWSLANESPDSADYFMDQCMENADCKCETTVKDTCVVPCKWFYKDGTLEYRLASKHTIAITRAETVDKHCPGEASHLDARLSSKIRNGLKKMCDNDVEEEKK